MKKTMNAVAAAAAALPHHWRCVGYAEHTDTLKLTHTHRKTGQKRKEREPISMNTCAVPSETEFFLCVERQEWSEKRE